MSTKFYTPGTEHTFQDRYSRCFIWYLCPIGMKEVVAVAPSLSLKSTQYPKVLLYRFNRIVAHLSARHTHYIGVAERIRAPRACWSQLPVFFLKSEKTHIWLKSLSSLSAIEASLCIGRAEQNGQVTCHIVWQKIPGKSSCFLRILRSWHLTATMSGDWRLLQTLGDKPMGEIDGIVWILKKWQTVSACFSQMLY
jgi:hypothetical protein